MKYPGTRHALLFVALTLLIILAPAPVLAGPGAHGPNGEHLDTAGTAMSTTGLGRLPDGSVQVPKTSQRRMGIRTLLAPKGKAALTVELPGRVAVDPNASGRVQAAFSGRIEAPDSGLPVAGQAVKKDDALAYLRPILDPVAAADIRGRLADLAVRRQLAQQKLSRLQSLQGTIPQKDIESAKSELRSLQAIEQSLKQGSSQPAPLVSPIDGVISASHVLLGQVVQAQDLLFDVIDSTRLVVEASTDDPALLDDIHAASLAGMRDLKLSLLGASRVLREGMLPLTFSVSSGRSSLPLAVGQSVRVIVQRQTSLDGIVLPDRALTRNATNEPVVWIKSGAERFVPQPVQYQVLDGTNIVVTEGLAADNRVVVDGAALIAQIR